MSESKAVSAATAAPEMTGRINCPFYGRHFFRGRDGGFLLVGQGGNECAAVTTSFAPCAMEQCGRDIDWRLCPVVTAISVDWPVKKGDPA